MTLTPLLSTLADIARTAGDLVLRSYRTNIDVEYKGPNDPVTSADRAANTLICEALHDEFPDFPIVAEESDPNAFGDYRSAERVFFVDPIDGTREFLDCTDEFVVMIGLVQGNRAMAGVIHAPTSGLFWAGEVGAMAVRFELGSDMERLSASRTSALGDSNLLVSRAPRSVRFSQHLESVGPRAVRSLGSAGLKGAMVAEGTADAYVALEKAGKRWDVCALDALVTAAGGLVTDLRGDSIDYQAESLINNRGLIVSNGRLHELLMAKLSSLLDPQV